jgi:hypothetical protein
VWSGWVLGQSTADLHRPTHSHALCAYKAYCIVPPPPHTQGMGNSTCTQHEQRTCAHLAQRAQQYASPAKGNSLFLIALFFLLTCGVRRWDPRLRPRRRHGSTNSYALAMHCSKSPSSANSDMKRKLNTFSCCQFNTRCCSVTEVGRIVHLFADSLVQASCGKSIKSTLF